MHYCNATMGFSAEDIWSVWSKLLRESKITEHRNNTRKTAKIWFDILMTSKNAHSWTRRSAIAEKASCICATMVMQYHSMSTLSAKLYSKKPLKRSDLFLKPPLQSPDLLVPLPRIRFPFRSRVCSRRENASCSCQSCVRDRGPYTQVHLTSVNLSVSVL